MSKHKPLKQQAPFQGNKPENLGPGRKDSGSDGPVQDLLKRAIELHRKGVEGDKEAVVKSYQLLEKAWNLEPENLLVEAYYGSAMALMGRDAIDPMERIKKAMAGLKFLDRAVNRRQDNVEIRILRAYVCYRLPESCFHRTGTALEDFKQLIGLFESGSGNFSKDFYHQILFDLGVCYKRLNREKEAEKTWQKLISKSGSKKYIDLLKKESKD